MTICIRPVEIKDNTVLAELIRAVFDEHGAPHQGTVYSDPTTDYLYELFQTPLSVLWVAELDTIIAGCCGVYPTPGLSNGCCELVKFYLSENARGKGIGRDLMQKSIDSARSFGYNSIYLESFPEFSKAVRIYENQGFQKIDHPMGNSGHTGCSIWMIKAL